MWNLTESAVMADGRSACPILFAEVFDWDQILLKFTPAIISHILQAGEGSGKKIGRNEGHHDYVGIVVFLFTSTC